MPKILVIRAERGKIVESKIVEGELRETVRKITSKALEEWDPEKSDFIVIKEKRKIETTQPVEMETLKTLENLEIGETHIQLPIYMISFDNTMIEEDNYVENKIYLITLYANEEIKDLLEIEAAEITTPIS
ncbi:MAG: DUF2286 domain-containing protein [Thermoprotei archaeon]|nr:DUF2286 domain-containing protein [Thermoprotei archaeon]